MRTESLHSKITYYLQLLSKNIRLTNKLDRTNHLLQERVKELTILHQTARLLQDEQTPAVDLMQEIVGLLPFAWQYPDIATAAITFREIHVTTPKHLPTPWLQRTTFTTRGGDIGEIVIAYTEARPDEVEGPFLAEERDLIESLGEMLRAYFQHKLADEELENAHNNLERLVEERTEDLRRLAAELSLAEARERRELASDLHDHIIQQFAFIKLRIQQFRGDAIFCGFEQSFAEIVRLLDGAIQHTRQLTFEISSPILYDLGLAAALERLAETQSRQHKIPISFVEHGISPDLPEAIKVTIYKCVQELLVNAFKYAQAKSIRMQLGYSTNGLSVRVTDDGVGFNTAIIVKPGNDTGFGLFSIRERMRYYGGTMSIISEVGQGTTVELYIPIEPLHNFLLKQG